MPSGSITITPGKQLIAGERVTNTKLNQGFAPTGRVDAATIGTRELIAVDVKTIIAGPGSMSFSAIISQKVILDMGTAPIQAFTEKVYLVPFTGAPPVPPENAAGYNPTLWSPTLIVTGKISGQLVMDVRPSSQVDFVEVILRNASSVIFDPVGSNSPRLRITMLNFA